MNSQVSTVKQIDQARQASLAARRRQQRMMFLLMRAGLAVVFAFLVLLVGFVFVRGLPVVNWEFLTAMPRRGMSEGSIYPAILGTFYLVVLSVAIAAALGVGTAVYLHEFAAQGRLVSVIRTAVNVLAGVPSVVFGLFGLTVFVNAMNLGVSILSGGLTLALVVLPSVIRAAEEGLASVPGSYREASIALGATRWQTVTRAVLPSAMPGILTGCILAVGRAAGETAPVMLTAATFFTSRLPSSVMDEVQVLSYHIYALITEGTRPDAQVPIAFGAAAVLLMLVVLTNMLAIVIRERGRRA